MPCKNYISIILIVESMKPSGLFPVPKKLILDRVPRTSETLPPSLEYNFKIESTNCFLAIILYLSSYNRLIFIVFRMTNQTALSNSHDCLCRTIDVVIMVSEWKRSALFHYFLGKMLMHRGPNFSAFKKRSYGVYSCVFIISF